MIDSENLILSLLTPNYLVIYCVPILVDKLYYLYHSAVVQALPLAVSKVRLLVLSITTFI